MAKLFGEFLIDAGLVSSEQVLSAVVMQLKSIPSVAEVVYEQNLISPEAQLRILGNQQILGVDYRFAASQLGLWDEGIENKVALITSSRRRPVGEVLVELNSISPQILSEALASYIAASSFSKTQDNPDPKTLIVTQNREFSLKNPDPHLLQEATTGIAENLLPVLEKIPKKLNADIKIPEEVNELLLSAKNELIGVRASAKFLELEISYEVCTGLIATIDALLKSENSEFAFNNLDALSSFFKMAKHLFSAITTLIDEFGSEKGLLEDANLQDIIARIKKLQDQLLNSKSPSI